MGMIRKKVQESERSINMNIIKTQIENKDGMNVVSSRVIANELGKRHADVVNQIEKIFNDEKVRCSIIPSNYTHNGNIYKEYFLTKDGFILYMFNIQGYNDFKMAYINEFNRMETALQEMSLPSYQIVDSIQRAKKWIEEETVRQEQAKQLQEQKPLIMFANTVANSNDYIDIGTFAKLLNDKGVKIGRNKLFEMLRKMKILMWNNQPYQTFIDQEYFVVKEYVIEITHSEKLKIKTLLTGKGQIWLMEKIQKSFKRSI